MTRWCDAAGPARGAATGMAVQRRPATRLIAVALALTGVLPALAAADPGGDAAGAVAGSVALPDGGARIAAGRRLFHEGRLASGETLTGNLSGGAQLLGSQAVCGNCHRRSGMGSIEGQEVVPAVTGDILYNPLQLPTVKPPAPPVLRPAYTDSSLKRAIREGRGADGSTLSGFMPRYALADEDIDALIAYLKTLQSAPAPGVDEKQMHFATIVSDGVDAATREAYLDVFRVYFEQKNRGTRHETERAANAPWHRAWKFKPYRKWALHVWELHGPPESWRAQLDERLAAQPVFAVLGGLVDGDWRPVHTFCEAATLPCLFPVTDLPVVAEDDFYSMYFSRGMQLEADVVAWHVADGAPPARPLVQVYQRDDPRSAAAAQRLRRQHATAGRALVDRALDPGTPAGPAFWAGVAQQAADADLVLWLADAESVAAWPAIARAATPPRRVYLSTTLFDPAGSEIPEVLRDRVLFVHPAALPARERRLLARSNGWLRVNRIAVPGAARIQADALFTLKLAGEAVRMIRGYFNQEYFLERIEHMAESATFTSVYPSVGLGPGQRFLSKGAYIARYDPGRPGGLVAVSDWVAADAR